MAVGRDLCHRSATRQAQPAMHNARRSALSRVRLFSSSETTTRSEGTPAASAVDRHDSRGGRRRARPPHVLMRIAPSAPSVRRRPVSVVQRLELEPGHDRHVGRRDRSRAQAIRVEEEVTGRPSSATYSTVSSGISSWQRMAVAVRQADVLGAELVVRAGCHAIVFRRLRRP